MILHTKSNMTSWMCKYLFFREGCIEKESDRTIVIVSMLIDSNSLKGIEQSA